MLRSCYKSSQKIYRDRPDVSVEGEWKFCLPGAVALPFAHPFVSRNWDAEGTTGLDTIGEQPGSMPWRNGEINPQLIGTNWCGTPTDWDQGGLYDERGTAPVNGSGLPLCCNLAPASYGGLMLDGSSTFSVSHTVEGSPGLDLDGAATFIGPIVVAGTGGLDLDGAATITGPYFPGSTGGLDLDGAATITGPFDIEGTGGLDLDGAATITGPFDIEGTGGLDLAGTATISFDRTITATGGLDLGGLATFTYTPAGQSWGGCSGVPFTLYLHLTGAGACSAWNGQTMTLTWNSGASRYEGTLTVASITMNARVSSPSSGTGHLSAGCPGFPAFPAIGGITCSPFGIAFGSPLLAGCCAGAIGCSVNATP